MERRHPTRLTPGEGRRFAFPVGAAFLVLAAILQWWRGQALAAGIVAAIGASLLVAGVMVPRHLGPVLRAWMALAHTISRITTPVFMALVYYVVLTPAGLLRRVFGRNPIRHAAAPDGSYWAPREDDQRRSNLERQF